MSELQEPFLRTLRECNRPVTVFLTNGVKLQGLINGYDNFCIALKRGDMLQLIYKHAIATIVPLTGGGQNGNA